MGAIDPWIEAKSPESRKEARVGGESRMRTCALPRIDGVGRVMMGKAEWRRGVREDVCAAED